ncbi:MAG: integrase arm-type DNA-binding domain-containing protein [Rhizomicrobium sp.]
MPLTALGVKNAKPHDKPYKLSDEKGLYLLVTPSGSKLWRFDYRFADKRKTLAFGKWDDVELVRARERRDTARKSLAAGRDPAIGDVQEEAVVKHSFETVARDWHAAAKTAWTPRYAKLVLGRLEADIFPHLGSDDIDAIEPPRLLEVIRKIEARDALEMAKRVKNHCSEIFQYGIAEGKSRRDPAAEIHRALKKPRPKKHMSAVPPSEFPTLVARMHAYDGDELTKLALVFTLITMVRTQETRFASIDEFENLDGQEPLWRLSPERMKMSREHLVPLPHQAVTIIKRLREKSSDSRYLFPGSTNTGVISENTMLYGLYRMGYHSRQTTHGLRRCASTILNESGKFEPDWIETQLAHADDDKVRGAYNAAIYLPHRRRMLQWWADFVEKPTNVYRIAA